MAVRGPQGLAALVRLAAIGRLQPRPAVIADLRVRKIRGNAVLIVG